MTKCQFAVVQEPPRASLGKWADQIGTLILHSSLSDWNPSVTWSLLGPTNPGRTPNWNTGLPTFVRSNWGNLAHDCDLGVDYGWYLSDWSNSKIWPRVGFEPTTLGFCIRCSPNWAIRVMTKRQFPVVQEPPRASLGMWADQIGTLILHSSLSDWNPSVTWSLLGLTNPSNLLLDHNHGLNYLNLNAQRMVARYFS